MMKKKLLALTISATIVASMSIFPTSAACNHSHDADCGYKASVACDFVCTNQADCLTDPDFGCNQGHDPDGCKNPDHLVISCTTTHDDKHDGSTTQAGDCYKLCTDESSCNNKIHGSVKHTTGACSKHTGDTPCPEGNDGCDNLCNPSSCSTKEVHDTHYVKDCSSAHHDSTCPTECKQAKHEADKCTDHGYTAPKCNHAHSSDICTYAAVISCKHECTYDCGGKEREKSSSSSSSSTTDTTAPTTTAPTTTAPTTSTTKPTAEKPAAVASTETVKTAVAQATAAAKADPNSTALYAKIENTSTVTADQVAVIVAAAQAAGKAPKIIADERNAAGQVTARLIVDATGAKGALNVGISTTNARATKTKQVFEKAFKNDVAVFSLSQRGNFDKPQRMAVKVDFDATKAVIYCYNPATGKATKMNVKKMVDKNGYLQFNTPVGYDIIISNGLLAK